MSDELPYPTCVHAASGLCPACQEEYDTDPLAYLEYGAHPDGIRRWRDLEAEMFAEPRPADDGPAPDGEIPF